MSLEMAHKVILPPKKNYIPQFLKQRDINSYPLITATAFSKMGGWVLFFKPEIMRQKIYRPGTVVAELKNAIQKPR
jgi:hypothetical protein